MVVTPPETDRISEEREIQKGTKWRFWSWKVLEWETEGPSADSSWEEPRHSPGHQLRLQREREPSVHRPIHRPPETHVVASCVQTHEQLESYEEHRSECLKTWNSHSLVDSLRGNKTSKLMLSVPCSFRNRILQKYKKKNLPSSPRGTNKLNSQFLARNNGRQEGIEWHFQSTESKTIRH